MWHEASVIHIIQLFLPSMGELIETERPHHDVCVLRIDLDGDGTPEIAAAYKWLGETYLLVLKYHLHSWRVAANVKGKGYGVSFFQAAPIMDQNRNNLVVGWQAGDREAVLGIYHWTYEGLKNIVKEDLYFSRIHVEDMAGVAGYDGKNEVALWRHDAGDAYRVNVYRWDKGTFVLASDLYPSYFTKVAQYYKQKVQEAPYASYYWYYLADAQLKEKKPYHAFKSLQRAIRLGGMYPTREELLSLQQQIEAALSTRDAALYPAAVKKIGGIKWGFINNQGQFILPPQYEDAQDFQDNHLAIVQSKGLYGLIDRSGTYKVKPKYQTILPFSEQRAIVIDGQGFKVIDERGKEVTRKAYSYIAPYEEGKALFSGADAQGKYLYGFLDRQGNEAIPLQYELAYDFNDGKALVKIGESKYSLIDQNGRQLYMYPYEFVGNLGEGLLAFQKSGNEKYGFIHEDGEMVIRPQFSRAQPFSNGRAVVNMSDDYTNRYGLINKEGSFVIPPQYHDIILLGQNRAAVGKAMDEKRPFIGSVYAIADTKGNFLTDFVYKGVSPYQNGYASAYDDEHTFFVDGDGNIVQSLPIVNGSGSLAFENDLIKAYTDRRLSYYNRAGNLIWKQNTIVPLNEEYKIKEVKFKPNKDYVVYYPQVEGILLKRVQERVNKKLKELSQVKKMVPNAQLDYSYTGDFQIPFFKKHLLVLELYGYHYPYGAAHGMPSKIHPHINLTNGKFYELKDLFKQDSDYVKVLSDHIANQIKADPQYSYVFPDSFKGIQVDQPFYVTDEALYLYFTPYEIAPYAAGFPTFKISFADIMTIIDVNGDFWRSFH
jgi:hypothetical protein